MAVAMYERIKPIMEFESRIESLKPARTSFIEKWCGFIARMRSVYGSFDEVDRVDTDLGTVRHLKLHKTSEQLYERYKIAGEDEQIPCSD